jgi:hypothetical protein
MDRSTKLKLAAGAGAVAAVAAALGVLGTVGALAVSGALSSDRERFVADESPGLVPPVPLSFERPEAPRLFGLPEPELDLDEAASYLGVSEDELQERLDDGETLADIARDEDRSVTGLVDELADAARERLDDAVDDGRLSPEHADRLADDLEDRIEDLVNGDLEPRIFQADCD